jgi:hypothetical protein
VGKSGLNIKKPQRLGYGSLSQVNIRPSRLVNRPVPKKAVEKRIAEKHRSLGRKISFAVATD